MNAPLNMASKTTPPEEPRTYFADGNYISNFDLYTHGQTEGFVELLLEQGISHKYIIPRGRAEAVAQAIGSEFQTSFICGIHNGIPDVIKGMTTTKEAYTAAGNILYLEDIVVIPEERRKGLARRLIENDLMTAWQRGLDGYALETGRNNIAAHRLYEKIDPAFNVENLHDVWLISERQKHHIAYDQNIEPARLADYSTDLDSIIKIMRHLPDSKFSHIIDVLERQERHKANGINDPEFIVASDTGTFALTSLQYSTFDACVRADTRIYFSLGFNGFKPEDGEKDFAGVMKKVSMELVRRRKRGPIHVEFSNEAIVGGGNVIALSTEKLIREKHNVAIAESALAHALGATRLVHDDSPMVAYHLTGPRYIAAVLDAVNRNPTSKILSDEKREALKLAAQEYGLELRQTGLDSISNTSEADGVGEVINLAASPDSLTRSTNLMGATVGGSIAGIDNIDHELLGDADPAGNHRSNRHRGLRTTIRTNEDDFEARKHHSPFPPKVVEGYYQKKEHRGWRGPII